MAVEDFNRVGNKHFSAITNATKATVIAASCLIDGIYILNEMAADSYLQMFNKLAADVSVGTTVPDFVIGIEANSSRDITFRKPIGFSIGLVIASTTERGNSTLATCETLITYGS